MRLELAQKASSQQLPQGPPLQRDSILAHPAVRTLLTRILDDLTKLSHWLNAITRPPLGPSNGKAFALQKAGQVPASPAATLKLLPQIQAIVDSAHWQNTSGVFVFDAVTVDFAAMEARRHGALVTLKTKEFKVLTYLIRNSGRVISREELLKEVWGYECYPNTRTVDNHILHLRQKLEPAPSRPRHFLTVHGAGYKFLPSE
jgi:DNA-binding winged helix-turn-helix (wHTH) protein